MHTLFTLRMGTAEAQEKIFNFISSWQQSCYKEEDEARRFYTFLGQVIQSKLMHDFVYLPEECPQGYEVAGTIPLMEYIRDYDLDEVYNNYFKQNTVSE